MTFADTRCHWLIALFLCCVIASPTFAQTADPNTTDAGATKPFIVGTKAAPPFSMQTENGDWGGLSIELWQAIAQKLNRATVFKTFETTDALVQAAADGTIDAGVAATSITSEREKRVDFSHPFYQSGLGIAISNRNTSGLFEILKALVSPAFLTTVGALFALLLLTGAVMWLVERKRNWDQFDQDAGPGIGDGFWWAAVTMTTVGYGDKAPVTLLGRIIAVIWMFAALILTAVFTAQLASSLTVNKIAGPVSGINDLPRARVAIVDKTASNAYFQRRNIRTTSVADVDAGLTALNSGRIDAFVHDAPILKYQILKNYTGQLDILPSVFEAQDYGIVLPPNSPYREAINQALLDVMGSAEWRALNKTYFGDAE